jgi:hypothetical protein
LDDPRERLPAFAVRPNPDQRTLLHHLRSAPSADRGPRGIRSADPALTSRATLNLLPAAFRIPEVAHHGRVGKHYRAAVVDNRPQ